MYQKILVPTDSSDYAMDAVKEAVSLAEQFDAKVDALYAVDVRVERPNPEVETYEAEMAAVGEEALADVEKVATVAGVEYESEIDIDDPRDTIVEYVEDHDVDLVVMGAHGRRGVKRLIVGSVTEGVVRLSDVPVLTVPRA
jgi:nucleotide-binding universal stress UspA family protein